LDLLVKRTARKDGRPLLLRDKPRKILQKLIEARYPTYEMADIIVETHDEPSFITLNKVLNKLDEYLK
jgi:shikimate kinase